MSQGIHLRKYGVQATFDFEVYEVDGVDLRVDWVPAQADCEIMKDGGASTLCDNTATDEGSTYSIVLTATEMQFARGVLKIVDAAAKVFLDKVIIIETYGNASAQHAMDFDDTVRGGLTALPNAAADAVGGLPISDAGGLDLDTQLAATNEVTAARMGALTDWINGGRLDLLLDAIPTTAMRGTDGALTDKAGFSLSAAGTLAIWHEALANIVTAASVGKLIKDEITSVRMATLTDWINGGRLDLILDAIPTTAMRGTDSAALASVCTEGRLAELDAANLPTDIAAIPTTAMRGTDSAALATVCTEARLAELAAANIPADVDSLITAIVTNAVGADVTADVATLKALLDTTTMAELGSGLPAATPTPLVAIMTLYMQWRNGLEQTATERRLRNAAGTEIADATMSDDGTTFDSGIMTAP